MPPSTKSSGLAIPSGFSVKKVIQIAEFPPRELLAFSAYDSETAEVAVPTAR